MTEEHGPCEVLQTLIEWRARHEGATDERRRSDDRWYSHVEGTLIEHGNRLTAVERKVVWISGFAAAAGAILGVLVTKVLV